MSSQNNTIQRSFWKDIPRTSVLYIHVGYCRLWIVIFVIIIVLPLVILSALATVCRCICMSRPATQPHIYLFIYFLYILFGIMHIAHTAYYVSTHNNFKCRFFYLLKFPSAYCLLHLSIFIDRITHSLLHWCRNKAKCYLFFSCGFCLFSNRSSISHSFRSRIICFFKFIWAPNSRVQLERKYHIDYILIAIVVNVTCKHLAIIVSLIAAIVCFYDDS